MKRFIEYKEAEPVTGLLTGPQFHTNDRSLNYTNLTIKTSVSKGTDLQTTFRKVEKHIIKAVENVMRVKKSFKMRLR
jgi:hypothetical protein